jgi:hypothetical protein
MSGDNKKKVDINTNDINNLPSTNNIINIQKMVFIYNALLSGWSVKMIENNTFEFNKNRQNRELDLDNLANFMLQNLNVDNIKKNVSK